VTSRLRLRMSDNEMLGLSSVGILVLGDDQVLDPKTSSLMMTGNRVTTTLESLIFEDLGKPDVSYFLFTTVISCLTRCVVSSNMIVNDASIGGFFEGRSSFWLDDSSGPPSPLAQTVPPPEIMVSANVFQGGVVITPAPSTNSWNFLNTMIA